MDGDQLISRKRGNHSGPDFLSDLPLDIIHCILQFIPIREVARACILSRRWRYIWATLPHLVFKGLIFLEWEGRLSNLITSNGPDIERWLLSLNEIRDLILGSWSRHRMLFKVHSSVYSCLKLTLLELHNCILPPPPLAFKGFSYLSSLRLHNVKLPSELLESLVDNAPLLENLLLITNTHTGISSELRICAPNLKCFFMSGDFKEIRLYAPLVAHVSVTLNRSGFGYGFPAEQQSPVCNYTKFLGGLANLEMLIGSDYFTQYLSIGIKSYDHSLVFHRLIRFILDMSFEDEDQLAVFGHLITSAPNLVFLSIFVNTATPYLSASPASTSYSDFGCGPDFTFNKLRSIWMQDLRGLPREMETVQYLLKRSPVLESISVLFKRGLESEQISSLRAEVLSYSRASPNICLDCGC